MVIGLIGESCTGKSTIANALKERHGASVYTGRDYLKLAKNEADAKRAFARLLAESEAAGELIVYVISETEQLSLLPEKSVRVLVTAALETIKERFAKRMGGKLPPPVAAMLEKKYGMFDAEAHHLRVDGGAGEIGALCEAILRAGEATT